jgi:hypothetical protein
MSTSFLHSDLSLAQLMELRLADSGYQIEETTSLSSIGIQTITLVKKNSYHSASLLYAGDGSVRIIGLEPGIPLLACISCIGTIRESNNGMTIVEVYSGNPNQLKGFEILLLKTHVETRRGLESLDFVHRNPGRIQNIAYSLLGEDMYNFAS